MSAPAKTARFLPPNQISELVWDSESDEEGRPGVTISEDEGSFQDEPGMSHLQPDHPTSSGQVSSEWATPTGPYTFHFTLDTALWPSEDCSTCLYRGAPTKERQ